ncbi:hypothetical protein [Pseudaestuariivita rosea]|uniref:hypothetical protein n=1 Tax=Pseudaestuariivita rosea TaxID=2763263 RepID=UPI001ABA6A77|nr:hypothetical protein [Pseudaestuariivita rosea]
MKRLLTTTAFVLSASAAAFAMTNDQLKDAVENELNTYDKEVNVDMLTEDQISAIYMTMTTGDSPLDKQRRIEQILEDAPSAAIRDENGVLIELPENNVRAQLQSRLAIRGFDVDVAELDRDTVMQLYAVVTSSESPAESNSTIESLLQ